jgi:hypothetical protein
MANRLEGLLDDVDDEAKKYKRGGTCEVTLLLRDLSDEEAAAFQAVLDDVRREGTAISRALKRKGIDLPASSINRHRRGGCRCQK